MMKIIYKVYLWFEGLSNIKTGKNTVRNALLVAISIFLLVVTALGIRTVVVSKAESDRINTQKEIVKKRSEQKENFEEVSWATEIAKVDDFKWDKLKDNPDDKTVERYANLLVGVYNEESRQNALVAVPWVSGDISSTLRGSQSSYGYYDKAKDIELLTSGRTYGEDSDYYMFVYNTTWNSTSGDKFPARESINLVLRDGKVTYWSHVVGRRK